VPGCASHSVCCLSLGVAGHGGDTTVVLPVAGHPDVALLAPGGAPGVLNDPEVLVAAIAAVADGEDTVVEHRGRAVRLVVDSAFVGIEGPVAGVNGDGHGADRPQGVLQSSLRALLDVDEADDGAGVVVLGEVARAVLERDRPSSAFYVPS